jgi:molecular chaperone GrpE
VLSAANQFEKEAFSFSMSKDGRHSAKEGKRRTQKIGTKGRSAIGSGEESLKRLLQKALEENEGLRDRLLRTVAELDNVLKRTEREKANLIQTANADLIKAILPILDDFDRSLKSYSKIDPTGFRSGIELIYQKLDSALKSRGLIRLEAVGQTFDVDKHEAILQSKKEGVPPNRVIEEFEKGYLLNGSVLRHAKVMVSG